MCTEEATAPAGRAGPGDLNLGAGALSASRALQGRTKPGPGRGLVLGALRGLARAGGSQSVQLHPGSRSDRVPFTEGPTFQAPVGG